MYYTMAKNPHLWLDFKLVLWKPSKTMYLQRPMWMLTNLKDEVGIVRDWLASSYLTLVGKKGFLTTVAPCTREVGRASQAKARTSDWKELNVMPLTTRACCGGEPGILWSCRGIFWGTCNLQEKLFNDHSKTTSNRVLESSGSTICLLLLETFTL